MKCLQPTSKEFEKDKKSENNKIKANKKQNTRKLLGFVCFFVFFFAFFRLFFVFFCVALFYCFFFFCFRCFFAFPHEFFTFSKVPVIRSPEKEKKETKKNEHKAGKTQIQRWVLKSLTLMRLCASQCLFGLLPWRSWNLLALLLDTKPVEHVTLTEHQQKRCSVACQLCSRL